MDVAGIMETAEVYQAIPAVATGDSSVKREVDNENYNVDVSSSWMGNSLSGTRQGLRV
jgi:hypothetical protein